MRNEFAQLVLEHLVRIEAKLDEMNASHNVDRQRVSTSLDTNGLEKSR